MIDYFERREDLHGYIIATNEISLAKTRDQQMTNVVFLCFFMMDLESLSIWRVQAKRAIIASTLLYGLPYDLPYDSQPFFYPNSNLHYGTNLHRI